MDHKDSDSPSVDVASTTGKELREVENVANGEVVESRYAGLSRWASVKTFKRAVLFCMILNWAAMNDGFQQQVPGNVIPMPAFILDMADTTVNGEPAISARIVSFWQGFGEMTKTLGMFAGGWFADRLGRKGAMLLAILILFGGSTAEITAHNWQTWLVGAMLIRLGVGLAQSVLVVYISEISPHQIRGFMIGSYQLSLGLGQLVCAVATQLVVTHRPTEWKPLIATEYLFTGVLAIIIWFVPESHIYYARKDDHEKAKRSMRKLYGYAQNYDLEYEYRVIQHGILAEQEINQHGKSKFFEIFQGLNWRRTLAGCVGICSQWAAGAPIVFSYSTYFFAVAGLENPFLVTIITFVLLIVSIFCALIACEHIGRRPLLIGGCALMFVFNVCLGTTGFFEGRSSDRAALAFLLLWVICYGLSAGPIGFIAAGETSTPRLRAQTTSFNLGCYGLGFVIFQWTISYMISPDAANLGVKAVYVWAGILVPTTVLLYLYYPETFGRTYWELDELYERRIPAWKFKGTPTLAEDRGFKKHKGPVAAKTAPMQQSTV